MIDLKKYLKTAVIVIGSTGVGAGIMSGLTSYFVENPDTLEYMVREYCKVPEQERIVLRKTLNARIDPLHAEIYCGATLDEPDEYLKSQFAED